MPHHLRLLMLPYNMVVIYRCMEKERGRRNGGNCAVCGIGCVCVGKGEGAGVVDESVLSDQLALGSAAVPGLYTPSPPIPVMWCACCFGSRGPCQCLDMVEGEGIMPRGCRYDVRLRVSRH